MERSSHGVGGRVRSACQSALTRPYKLPSPRGTLLTFFPLGREPAREHPPRPADACGWSDSPPPLDVVLSPVVLITVSATPEEKLKVSLAIAPEVVGRGRCL